jgi:3-deoxy-manno-octulosonate cytidylyltransferase (CMP-KDO synthetase)
VVRVWQRVQELGVADEVVVATDAEVVAEVVTRAGGRAILTSPHHQSGTERIAEVVRRKEFLRYDVVLNVQGDEPFLPEGAARGALDRVAGGDRVGTAAAPLDPALASDPGRVKVVVDERGRALYFSRAPIPWPRDPDPVTDGLYWQHLGLYAYRREALLDWVALPPVRLERVEMLEQLRPLAHGMTIGVARLTGPALPGIDTAEDLAQANDRWHRTEMGAR